MAPKKKGAVSIDHVDIDFTSAAAPQAAAASSSSAVAALLSERTGTEDSSGQLRASEMKAFDPAMQSYVQRTAQMAAGGRRRRTFGGPPPPVAASTTVNDTANDGKEAVVVAAEAAAAAAAAAFLQQEDEQQQGPAIFKARREAYESSLRSFCKQGLPWATGSSSSSNNASSSSGHAAAFPSGSTQCNSLLQQLFADGVPDIEPWDRWAFTMPSYDQRALAVSIKKPQSTKDVVDLVQHPVLRDTHYTRHYQHEAAKAPVEAKLMKTKDELRAERRERLKKKQDAARQERAAAKARGETTGNIDRLGNKNLVLNMFSGSVLNPIAADSQVLDQYQQRFMDHQRRNHDRHVAALPNQIAKREREALRHAEERPVFRAYRVYPIYSAVHLGKLRNFANDGRLRGAILWVGSCDAVILLAGGEVAMRHLDRWILHKMAWEHTDTRAVRLCSVPLMRTQSLSFHRQSGAAPSSSASASSQKRAKTEEGEAPGERVSGDEPVFMNFCDTVAEGEAFMRSLPAAGSAWADFASVWRIAFLGDGLKESTADVK